MFELPKELFEVELNNLEDIEIKPRLHNDGWCIYYNFKKKMGYDQCIWISLIIDKNNKFEFHYCSNINSNNFEIQTVQKRMEVVANYLEVLGYKLYE